MQQQITRGDYLEDLITIYIDNNLQQSLTDLYSMFVFQCGEIQKQLTPASVIKISFTEAESKLLTNYNTCYLAGITQDGHKETFNGSISFNTRGEVVYYEPTPNGSLQATTTSVNDCPCRGITGVFANCTQPAIKAYFSINYIPTKLSELQNDTDFQDSVDVASSIATHNASEEAHPYIRSVLTSTTEALAVSIQAETTAREEAVSLAIQTTEGYADTLVAGATTAINTTIGDLDNLDTTVKSSVVNAINSEVSDRQSADSNLQTQIDGLAAASDVTDIVGTYAELQAYDTQHLNNNDIIKVLSDETHDDEPSYYRFNKTAGTFSYIGSESAAYTKAQSNSIFVAQTTTVNNKPLSSDITLTYSDVNALSNTYATTIAGNTSAIAANTSNISTINGKIPTDASSSNKLATASDVAAKQNTITGGASSIADTNLTANRALLSDANGKVAVSTATATELGYLGGASSNIQNQLDSKVGYFPEWSVKDDATLYEKVNKLAHSTFDRSKFTVVGSPIITSDGILKSCAYPTTTNSAWSTIEQLKCNFDLTTLSGKSWTISVPFNFNNNRQNGQRLFSLSGNSDRFDWYSIFRIVYNNIVLTLPTGTTGSLNQNSDVKYIESRYFSNYLNQDMIISLSFDVTTSTYTMKLADTNGNIPSGQENNWVKTFTPTTENKELQVINGYTANGALRFTSYYGMTEDLKGVKIIADGVPVFSGNKTGIDTIKPDDYTEINSPTITADGVLTNTSTNNYLTKSFTNFDWGNWEIRFKNIKSTADETFRTFIDIYGSGNNYIGLKRRSTTTQFQPNTYQITVSVANVGIVSKQFTAQDTLDGYFGYDGTKYYWNINGVEDYVESNARLVVQDYTAYFGKDYGSQDGGYLVNASEDLNCIEFYKNGDLFYQPCLKIPYTEAELNQKVVDVAYRDRVKDLFEQEEYNIYYTLGENDFTLPSNKPDEIVKYKANGLTVAEQRADQTLTIRGACEQGVDVNLPMEFFSADSYAVFGVGTTGTKTASKFTPAADGNYIAIGKGKV